MTPASERQSVWRSALAGLWLAGLLSVGGCSTLSRATADSVGLLVHGDRAPAFVPDAAKVAARPYFQLEVDAPRDAGLWILGNVDHGREAWYDAGNAIVFLRHGVLVKTWNLAPDIVTTHLPPGSPFVTGLEHVTAPMTTTRTLDLPDYRYGVTATSQLVPAGMHDVSILGHTHHLLRIDEHLAAPAIGFAADNAYWVDPADGFVWKSRQTIPGGMTLTLTQLRPYRTSQQSRGRRSRAGANPRTSSPWIPAFAGMTSKAAIPYRGTRP